MTASIVGKPIRVMSGLALEVAVNRWIKPSFEASSGAVLEFDWRPTAALMRDIASGARADMIIAISDSMVKLVGDGLVRPETRRVLADSVLGIGVKAGAAKPDITTVDAFKSAVVAASAVAYSQAGASGIYFAGLIERLGIAKDVNARAVVIPMGFTAEKVASGEAELAVQQISELMSVPGIDVVGPFPAEIQVSSTFEVAVFRDAVNPDGAHAFLEMLTSTEAGEAYQRGGLESRL
ncbi:MAG: substrate-binding domain-containing protein [Hyphomicrobiaceae bacterium]